jgi:hypothetical protein
VETELFDGRLAVDSEATRPGVQFLRQYDPVNRRQAFREQKSPAGDVLHAAFRVVGRRSDQIDVVGHQRQHSAELKRVVRTVAVHRANQFRFGMANARQDCRGNSGVLLVPNESEVGFAAEHRLHDFPGCVLTSIVDQYEIRFVTVGQFGFELVKRSPEVRQRGFFVVARDDDGNRVKGRGMRILSRLREECCRYSSRFSTLDP